MGSGQIHGWDWTKRQKKVLKCNKGSLYRIMKLNVELQIMFRQPYGRNSISYNRNLLLNLKGTRGQFVSRREQHTLLYIRFNTSQPFNLLTLWDVLCSSVSGRALGLSCLVYRKNQFQLSPVSQQVLRSVYFVLHAFHCAELHLEITTTSWLAWQL